VLEAASIDLEKLTSYGLPIIIDLAQIPATMQKNGSCSGSHDCRNAGLGYHQVCRRVEAFVAANDFPVQVIPTQIFINADGTPYLPSEDVGITSTLYQLQGYRDARHSPAHQGGLPKTRCGPFLPIWGWPNDRTARRFVQMITSSGWLAPYLRWRPASLLRLPLCALSGIPLVVGYYVGGTGQRDPKKAFLLSVTLLLAPP
jgi:thioredoxin 1